MGTTIRPELSEKNPYWIEKHRYYELKHFCLQYPIWRKAYSVLDGYANPPKDLASFVVTSTLGDPTAKCAMPCNLFVRLYRRREDHGTDW